MEETNWTSYLFLYIVAAWVIYACFAALKNISKAHKDSWGWNDRSAPDVNATIVGTKSGFVRLRKTPSLSSIRTVFHFSDGFWYQTHTANRKRKFMIYEFTIDDEELKLKRDKAISVHRKEAIQKVKETANSRNVHPIKKARPIEVKQNTPTFWEGEDEDIPF